MKQPGRNVRDEMANFAVVLSVLCPWKLSSQLSMLNTAMNCSHPDEECLHLNDHSRFALS